MGDLGKIFNTLLFTEFGKKNAEGWMFLIAAVISIAGWISAREVNNRIRRTKDMAKQNLNANKVMHASCRSTDTELVTTAKIQQEDTRYVLSLLTQSPSGEKEERKRNFDTLESLAEFLEKETILRLGDFK